MSCVCDDVTKTMKRSYVLRVKVYIDRDETVACSKQRRITKNRGCERFDWEEGEENKGDLLGEFCSCVQARTIYVCFPPNCHHKYTRACLTPHIRNLKEEGI